MKAQEIIEKIRAEVERRNGYISVTHFVEELLSVLSDIEKEEKLNSQWSEEDNIMVKDIINAIDTNYASSDWHEMVDWLKSLHLKVKSEKPTTAEELEEEIKRYLEPIHTTDIQFEPFTQMTKWTTEAVRDREPDGRHTIRRRRGFRLPSPFTGTPGTNSMPSPGRGASLPEGWWMRWSRMNGDLDFSLRMTNFVAIVWFHPPSIV